MSSVGLKQRPELKSWGEIAQFLGVSVRTAQRYETEMGLPVRRLGGEKGRAVAAYVDDLIAWKGKNVPTLRRWQRWWNEPKLLQRYAIACSAAVLIFGLYTGWDLHRTFSVGQPHSAYWRGPTLAVTDEHGREVWRRTFTDEPDISASHAISLHDLDLDGRVETIIPLVPTGGIERDSKGGYLLCTSNKGEELWKIQPQRVVADAKASYSGVYTLKNYKVFPSPQRDGTLWTVAAFIHVFEYPSVMIVVDSKGQQIGEYWHSGHLDHVTTADLDQDGIDEILAAGMTLGLHEAVVRVFDPRHVHGADSLPPDDPHQLRGFAPGTEKATLVFGRSRLSRRLAEFNWAYLINPARADSPDRLWQVSIAELSGEGNPYLVYTIRPDLTLSSIQPSVALLNVYREQSAKDPSMKPFSDDDLEELRRGYRVERE